MNTEVKITGCYHICSFFGNSIDGMCCEHPYWKDKGAYDNMIITQQNSRNGKIPEDCPLRNERLVMTYCLNNPNVAEHEENLYEFIMANPNGTVTKFIIPCSSWIEANRIKTELKKTRLQVDFNKK